MTIDGIMTLLTLSPVVPLVVGAVGSLLESVGGRFGLPRLAAFGKALEGIALDLPKVLANLKAIGSGKAVK